MYMSQLAYKTVAFTLILDPRPSRPESVAKRALDALLSISLKTTDQPTQSNDYRVGPRPKFLSYDYKFANEMHPVIASLRDIAVIKYLRRRAAILHDKGNIVQRDFISKRDV